MRSDGECCGESRLLASGLRREGRGMGTGPQPTSTPPPPLQDAQRSRLKRPASGNEDLWHLSTMNYLGGPVKQAARH